MQEGLPDYLKQGEIARLFPVLSTTSKEGRTTSILLACMSKVSEFGSELLASVGQRVGKRATITTFTEICFRNQPLQVRDRPDGLIVIQVGSREWRALVEAKVSPAQLEANQIERYRLLAKENAVDCVITISNQFSTDPSSHPIEEVRKSRSKVPVFHWSWMQVLTLADLLLSRRAVEDQDQRVLLNELRRFLTHESAGVRGFDRMPPAWIELNKLVSSGGTIGPKSAEAITVIEAWHQEMRDLSLILSRLTETVVTERIPRNHHGDPAQRVRDEMIVLRERCRLFSSLDVPDAAATIKIVADLTRRSIDAGMTLTAPGDKKTTKARVNWLLRQIRTEKPDDIYERLLWPGSSEPTQFPLAELRDEVAVCEAGKEHLVTHSFHVFLSRRTGPRFTQQSNFIADLEDIVPDFYRRVGSSLAAWKPSAPRIKDPIETAHDVGTEAIGEESEHYDATSQGT